MDEWIRQALAADTIEAVALPAALLLGVLGSVGACCTLPVLGAVVGYASSVSQERGRRELILIGIFFMLGTIASLAVLGAVAGLVGSAAGSALGRYWRLAAGMALVLFGLISLDLTPFRIPKLRPLGMRQHRGVGGAVVYGLAVGGATTACSLGCNPLVPMALGAAMVQGATLLGAAVLGAFAIGYSLPLTAALVGLGLGLSRLAKVAEVMTRILRIGAGVVLIGVGFYLLGAS